jgi:3-phenylpropionate/trans-cinnamate dioxygenase ferredoxin component
VNYVKVANVSDVPLDTMFAAKLGNDALLIANIDDKFYAIQRICPHFGADLCAGNLEGTIVTCPKHGAKFDVTNGISTGKAGIAFLKFKVKNCKTYSIKKDGKDLLVARG